MAINALVEMGKLGKSLGDSLLTPALPAGGPASSEGCVGGMVDREHLALAQH